MACYQIFAFFHFEGLFRFFCDGIPSRRRSLCLSSSSSFFSASKARPLSLAAIVFRTAFASGLGLAFAPDRLSSIRFFRRRRCRKISLPRFGFAVWLFFCGIQIIESVVDVFFFERVERFSRMCCSPFVPQRHLWFPSRSSTTLSPPVFENVPAAFWVLRDLSGFSAGREFFDGRACFFFFYVIAPMHFH